MTFPHQFNKQAIVSTGQESGHFSMVELPILYENFWETCFEFLAHFFVKSVPQQTDSEMEIYMKQVKGVLRLTRERDKLNQEHRD